MHTDKANNEFLIGATLGCFVGAATALLLTPLSGKNLRKNIVQEVKKRQHEVNGLFHHYPHQKAMKKKTRKPVMKNRKTKNARARA